MKETNNSTKVKPLHYLEFFLNESNLIHYENMFFDYPINPSMVSNRREGFIEYTDSVYENEPIKPRRKYYKDYLLSKLNIEKNISIRLLNKRKDEIEYSDDKPDLFLIKQLNIIYSIREEVSGLKYFDTIYSPTMKELEFEIKNLLKPVVARVSSTKTRKTINSYFGTKDNVRKKVITDLYEVSLDLEIFDETIVTENDFLTLFFANNQSEMANIQFNVDNQLAVHYLNTIKVSFKKLKHSRLASSKRFYNRHGKLFNQGDFDSAFTRFNKKPSNERANEISIAINKILS